VLSSVALLLAVSHAGDASQYYEDGAVAVAFALLGALVAAHRPENPIGWPRAACPAQNARTVSLLLAAWSRWGGQVAWLTTRVTRREERRAPKWRRPHR
jgi:hypothetical protein